MENILHAVQAAVVIGKGQSLSESHTHTHTVTPWRTSHLLHTEGSQCSSVRTERLVFCSGVRGGSYSPLGSSPAPLHQCAVSANGCVCANDGLCRLL